MAEGAEQKGTLQQIVRLCQREGIALVSVRRRDLDEMGGGLEHQGVIAEVSAYPYVELDDLYAISQQRQEDPFFLVLDSLQDPQNVGSLLRTAEAVGIHGVILPERRAVGITAAVSRASAGAVEHLSACMVTNVVRTIEELKTRGTWVVGVEETPAAQDYRTVNLNMPLALVMGSEGAGMRRLVLERCDLVDPHYPCRGIFPRSTWPWRDRSCYIKPGVRAIPQADESRAMGTIHEIGLRRSDEGCPSAFGGR